MTREEIEKFVIEEITENLAWTSKLDGAPKRVVTELAQTIADRWLDDVVDQRAAARAEGARIATGGF